MNRRTVLVGVGAGFVVLAGCSGTQDAEPTTAQPSTQTPAGSPVEAEARTSTPEAGEAERATGRLSSPLQLLSIDAPGRVEITRSVGYQFTVHNPVREPLVYEPSVSVRDGSSGWSTLDRWEPLELAPGEIRTFKSSGFTSEYLATKLLRIDGLGEVFAIDFVERRLPFRESHRDPLGRDVSVRRVEIRDNFEYTNDGYERFAEAGEDRSWLFLTVKAINRLEETVVAPPYRGFSLRNGPERYRPVPTEHDDAYEPVQLPSDGVASGLVVFNVPEALSRHDVFPVWHGSFDGGDVRVVWTPL